MKKIVNLFICFSFILLKVFGQQTEHLTLDFDVSLLSCSTLIGEDGKTYIKMSYPDCDKIDIIGHPTLPVKFIHVLLPHDATNISLEVQHGETFQQTLSSDIFPAQDEIMLPLDEPNPLFVPCDTSLYSLSTAYPAPSEQVHIVGISCVGKGEKLVTISVCPLIYYPSLRTYDFVSSFSININYISYQRQISMVTAEPMDIGLPYYEYCIITTQHLKDSFSRLVAWRRQQGTDAGIVCIEDILDNPYITGDTVSHIYDDAGKIRQYLQYAYNNAEGKTKSVLLGGNANNFPIRYGCKSSKSPNDTISLWEKVPTDLYFSELTSNWNLDGDQFYGEVTDHINYGYSIATGRLLCETPEEIEHYTNKLLRYELNPGNGDFSYLKKALYTQADEMQADNQAQAIADELETFFPIDTIFSELPGHNSPITVSPSGSDVIAEMRNHYGFTSWLNHGNPTSFTVRSDYYKYNPYGVSAVQGNTPFITAESGNGLDNMDNAYYPMIAYSIACTLAPFDTYTDSDGFTYNQTPNIGQSFTLGGNYGGPAIIANTRSGYTDISYLLQKEFIKYIDDYTIGEAQGLSKLGFCNWFYYRKHHLGLTSNLIGCPNVRIWTDTPHLYNATFYYSGSGNSGRLRADFTNDSTIICIRKVCDSSDNLIVEKYRPNGISLMLSDIENSLITLTGKNCLPKILPLFIQNTEMHGKHYMLVTDMTCGSNVRNGTAGDVLFDTDADYTIEYSGEVVLSPGTEIKYGASVNIIPSIINF